VWGITKLNFFKVEGVRTTHLVGFFLLKALAGIGLTLVYTYYYTDKGTADIYHYFKDSIVVSCILFVKPLAWLKVITGIGMYQPDTFKYIVPTAYFSHPGSDVATNNSLIIRITSLFNYLSLFNIYINTLLFNMLGFVGLVAILKAVKPYFAGNVKWLYIPLFLLPSVVFWGSGMLKEQLMLTFIGFYILLHNRVVVKHIAISWIIMVVLFLAVYSIKPSVAACLLLATFFLPGFQVYKPKRLIALGITVVVLLIAAIALNLPTKVANMLLTKHAEYAALAISENAGSALYTSVQGAGVSAVIKLIPTALTNAIARPFLWSHNKVFQLAFALDNTAFLLLIIFLLFRAFQFPKGEKRLLMLFCLTFAITNYLIIGLTIPVMGAIVHYRIIAAPFLLLAVLLCVDLNAVKAKN